MKRIFFTTIALASMTMGLQAAPQAEFEKTTQSFGTFSESSPVQKVTFPFKNTGDAPLVINQAVASCGCTVPKYTKTPIKPGESGVIEVTYNGAGKFPGHFKKAITINTNGVPKAIRLYIEGDMTAADAK